MTVTQGTYTWEFLLSQTFNRLDEYDITQLLATVRKQIAFVNDEVSALSNMFASDTIKNKAVWGTGVLGRFQEVDDDLNTGDTKRNKGGVALAFPLRQLVFSTGFTREFQLKATPADLAEKVQTMAGAYASTIVDEIRFAIFNDDNYTFKDRLNADVPDESLAVKAFLNADSAAIPPAPNGTTFTGASHNHYVGTAGASLAYTDIDTLIANVREHGLGWNIELQINAADVATLVGLASTKFVALTRTALAVPGRTSGTLATIGEGYDQTNYLAGYWDMTPVYVRPWVDDNYYVAIAVNAGEKPLKRRQEPESALQGLLVLPSYGQELLTVEMAEVRVGYAPYNRAACAVLDGAHQTNYTEPTLVR